jgi:hypothetical protein
MNLATLVEPNQAWAVRWNFVADMNLDGVITISDFFLWVKWIFYAPGDFILFMLMFYLPSVCKFLEISTASLYGWWSLGLSIWIWASISAGANEI